MYHLLAPVDGWGALQALLKVLSLLFSRKRCDLCNYIPLIRCAVTCVIKIDKWFRCRLMFPSFRFDKILHKLHHISASNPTRRAIRSFGRNMRCVFCKHGLAQEAEALA